MYLTTEQAREKFPWAYIRARAYIREGAYIGARADIGEGAYIATVCSKYNGNIIPMKDEILIRIGCETHPIDYWNKHGAVLARKHDESVWWNETGKNILTFLKAEAKNYEKGG